jgi:hypothetical protein
MFPFYGAGGQLFIFWIVSAIRVGAESNCNREWGREALAFTVSGTSSCRVRCFYSESILGGVIF